MKRTIAFLLSVMMIFSLWGCSKRIDSDGTKIKVVALLFAEYDLAKHIAGNCAEVKMLLPPGSESHTYDPAPQDIIAISQADIFVCGGGLSESWVDTVLSSSENKEMTVIRMTEVCQLKEEEIVEGMQAEKEDDSETEYDEHVWTSPKNAVLILNEIEKAFVEKDPDNAETYRKNADSYRKEIIMLDKAFEDIVISSKRNEMIFADRFPMRYFADEYGLLYYAAFPGCSGEAEPSASTVKFLIDKVREDNIPAVFTIEFSNKAIAHAIKDETGADILLFHSCHNVTGEEFENGATYVSLMTQNLENLREALNR